MFFVTFHQGIYQNILFSKKLWKKEKINFQQQIFEMRAIRSTPNIRVCVDINIIMQPRAQSQKHIGDRNCQIWHWSSRLIEPQRDDI